MTALRFPADFAVGELEWEDAREPGGQGHLLAIGVVEVPDGTSVSLSVGAIAEVGVFGPDGTPRVTWHQGMPDSATRNSSSVWGGGRALCYVQAGEGAVDLGFIQGLPADSVCELALSDDIIPASFAAVAHLAPSLRHLAITLDWLGDDALCVVADLPALESLQLLGGSFTGLGLQRLGRLRNLQALHVEREGLPPSAFGFAAGLPRLTRLTGLDETDNPMPPAELDQLRRMLPAITVH